MAKQYALFPASVFPCDKGRLIQCVSPLAPATLFFLFHSMNVPSMLVHDAPGSSQASKHCSSRSRFAILLLLRLLVVLVALHLGHLAQHVLEMRLDELGEVCLE